MTSQQVGPPIAAIISSTATLSEPSDSESYQLTGTFFTRQLYISYGCSSLTCDMLFRGLRSKSADLNRYIWICCNQSSFLINLFFKKKLKTSIKPILLFKTKDSRANLNMQRNKQSVRVPFVSYVPLLEMFSYFEDTLDFRQDGNWGQLYCRAILNTYGLSGLGLLFHTSFMSLAAAATRCSQINQVSHRVKRRSRR